MTPRTVIKMAKGTPSFARLFGGAIMGSGVLTSDSNALLAEDGIMKVLTARTYQEKQRIDTEEVGEVEGDGAFVHMDGDQNGGGETTSYPPIRDDPELRLHTEELEALEFTADVFSASTSLRNYGLNLFKTMASSLAIIIALKHTSMLTKANQVSAYVAAVLIFLVYVISQLTYYIGHWLKWANLQKRRSGKGYMMASFERTEIEEMKDALETLWGVRMATVELVALVTRDILELVNTYITFILLAVVLDQINTCFNDGKFLFEKLIELVIIVLLVFAGFACTNYRRDTILKPYRL